MSSPPAQFIRASAAFISDTIQPPKMSLAGVVSAGIANVRSAHFPLDPSGDAPDAQGNRIWAGDERKFRANSAVDSFQNRLARRGFGLADRIGTIGHMRLPCPDAAVRPAMVALSARARQSLEHRGGTLLVRAVTATHEGWKSFPAGHSPPPGASRQTRDACTPRETPRKAAVPSGYHA